MPTYSYVCDICGEKFDRFVRFSEDPNHVACPNHHQAVRRVFTTPAIVFKGKGFYATDSRPAAKETSSD
jgi:putative FmdB family regulatory protein